MRTITQEASNAIGTVDRLSKAISGSGSNRAGIKAASRGILDIAFSSKSAVTQVQSLKGHLMQIGMAAVGVYGVATAIYKIKEYAMEVINYLAKIETATLGIAASFLVSGSYVDKITGKVLQGQEALMVSQRASKAVIDQLRVANYQTAATLDELIFAYEVTLPVAMANGFNKKQVMDFTLAMVQAAGSIGLAYDQIAEETRSLLTGNVTRNSRIAQILQLNNNKEYLDAAKQGGKVLFDYLDKRLAGFKLAGLEVMNTWQGMWSNFKDTVQQGASFGFEDLFGDIKTQVIQVMDSIRTVDLITKEIHWNPEFLGAMQTLGTAMTDFFESVIAGIKWLYEYGKYLKILVELMIMYKLAVIGGSIAQQILTRTVTEEIVVQENKRKAIWQIVAAKKAEREANIATTTATVADIQADIASIESKQARIAMQQEVNVMALKEVEQNLAIVNSRKAMNAGLVTQARVALGMHTQRKAQLLEELALVEKQNISMNQLGRITTLKYKIAEVTKLQTYTQNRYNQAIDRENVLNLRSEALLARQASLRRTKSSLDRLSASATSAMTSAEAANTAAIGANTAALRANQIMVRAWTAAVSASKAVLTFFGGWIGLITTALLLGYLAWEKWGNAAEKALKQAEKEAKSFGQLGEELKLHNEYLDSLSRVEEAKKKGVEAPAEDKLKVVLGEMNYLKYNESIKKEKEHLAEYNRIRKEYMAAEESNHNGDAHRAFQHMMRLKKIIQEGILDRETMLYESTKSYNRDNEIEYIPNPKKDRQDTIDKALRSQTKREDAWYQYKKSMNELEIAGHKNMMNTLIAQEEQRYDLGYIGASEYYEKIRDIRQNELALRIKDNRKNLEEAENSELLKLAKTVPADELGEAANALIVKQLTEVNKLRAEGKELVMEAGLIDARTDKDKAVALMKEQKQFEELVGTMIELRRIQRSKDIAGHNEHMETLLDIEKKRYKTGEITAKTYYDNILKIQQDNIQEQINITKANLAEAQKAPALVNENSTNKSMQARIKAMGVVEKLQKTLIELEKELGAVAAKNGADSVKSLGDSLAARTAMFAALLRESQAQNELEIAGHKQKLRQELELEKYRYDQGLIAAKEHFLNVKALQQADLKLQIEAIKKTLNTATVDKDRLLKEDSTDPKTIEKQSKARTKVIELQTKLNELMAEYERVGVSATVSIAKSFEDLNREYEGIYSELIRLSGDYVTEIDLEVNSEAALDQIQKLQVELVSAYIAGEALRASAARTALDHIEAIQAFKMNMAPAQVELDTKLDEADILGSYRREQAILDANFKFKKKLIIEEIKLRKAAGQDFSDLSKKQALLGEKYQRESLNNTLNEVSAYASMAGELFTQLASTQDQTSKSGFESAKAFNIAATIMNTAAAVMAQLTIPGPIGWAAAALAAATGVIQLANIMSTSFGGGGRISQPGNFSAGGGGGTGTVLGDSTKVTESMGNSNDLLEEIHAEEYRELQKIADGISNLNRLFKGMASSLVRAFGGFTSEDMGIKEFSKDSLFTNLGESVSGLFFDTKDIVHDLFTGIFGDTIGSILSLPFDFILGGSGWLSDKIGDLGNSIFGGKVSKKMIDSGIDFGTISGYDMYRGDTDIQSYAHIKEKKDGGLFGSDKKKYWYEYQDLDDSTAALFDKAFSNFGDILMGLATSLGTNTQKILNYQMEIGKVSLQGLTGEEISKKISEVFSYAGDKAVEDLFGDILREYQEINEGLLETAVRIAATKEVVVATLNATGIAMGSLANLTAEKWIEISQNITTFAGGLDKFQESASTYYNAFFTEEEKQRDLQNGLKKSLAGMNMILPSTREGFRKLVESINILTESGQSRYVQMLELAEAADQYYSTLEEATTSYKDMILEAIDVQIAATQALKDIQQGSLSTLSPEQKYNQLKDEFDSQRGKALSGDTLAQQNIVEMAKEFLGVSQSFYGSSGGYVSDYNDVTAVLAKISGMPTQAATQLDLLQLQIDRLVEIRDAIEENLGDDYASEAGALAWIKFIRENLYTNPTTVMYSIDNTMQSYAVGTPYVDRDMQANIHEGEMIIDRASAEVFRKYGISVEGKTSDNRGVEDRLDKVVNKLGEVERRLSSIDAKARLAANS
jgi:hypothetical protein